MPSQIKLDDTQNSVPCLLNNVIETKESQNIAIKMIVSTSPRTSFCSSILSCSFHYNSVCVLESNRIDRMELHKESKICVGFREMMSAVNELMHLPDFQARMHALIAMIAFAERRND